MEFTAKQIADILQGEIEGNTEDTVFKLAKIEEAEKGSLTFLANPKYEPYIYTTSASIAIVSKDFIAEKEITSTLIRVSDPYKSFSTLLEYYNQVKNNKVGRETPIHVSSSAFVGSNEYIGAFVYIGDNVQIGNNVKIYPNSYIGDNVKIGDDSTIFSGVKIYSETVIGKGCKIHSGTVVGSDGFGFTPDENGIYKAVPQTGNVIIEDYVDIGANSTIDRATLGSTIIKSGVKLDNQIQVAHNVEIGKNTVIASQSGVAGSTKIGENCMIGGQVGIVGHITIGNNVKIQAQSGIGRNLKDGDVVQGSPAIGYSDFNKSYVYFKNLPKIVSTVNKLEKEYKAQQNQNE
ncbi:UDP-3-O-(3-hydroxymyristoyl)glucosamine N-acyltransferase [Tenacibaculum jejuense]|uniref:UDP-3-O-acylglucosamine N-acyltransferase n=1 Tax=Tenacibaculum jejuense TaxID=584609 RepID=A0A238UB53_9FLAO|nr:UDP-3-O-(3-hydroxymyristoyl)glucosamine N-acyltransferase [Tenacibaculum jejuense]SNR15714.1 UDP-3-O-[3-hydroxymyristoyl] glucosamine N-acyltransferase [Tenacibaculum jejuense]